MSSYFEELQQEQGRIEDALRSGVPQGELFEELREAGVKTTETRLEHFCEKLEQTEKDRKLGVLPPSKGTLHEDYPQLFPLTDYVLGQLLTGTTPLEAWALVRALHGICLTQEQVADFCERLIEENYPTADVPAKLYQIPETSQTWKNSMPVVEFTDGGASEAWAVSDVCQGIAIFGAPGSGKTTGSGRLFASRFLQSGFGGLVLTAKQQETQDWMKLCHRLGRGNDTIVVELQGCVRINLIEYEAGHPGLSSSMTSNLVQFFQNLLSVLSTKNNNGINDDFWKKTGNQLLANLFDTFVLAKEPITLDGLCKFVDAAPLSKSQANDGAWQNIPYFSDVLSSAATEAGAGSPADLRIFQKLSAYWLQSYPALADETRSCITISFSAMSEVLRQRHIYELVSTYTSITPEQILGGKIVILNLPSHEYHDAGLLVQGAWKYLLQRAILRRKDSGESRRPVFIWEDEGQNFILDSDNEFQAVSREYRATRVLISQNLNNLYARFGGGDYARTKVDALLANMNTKIFHANGDLTTNKWASEYLGEFDKVRTESTQTEPYYPGFNPFKSWLYKRFKKSSVTHAQRIQREPIIKPQDFMTLQRGDESNGYTCHAIVSQIGRRLFGLTFFIQASFHQFDLSGPEFPQDLIDKYASKLES